jgi:hypothetical protein
VQQIDVSDLPEPVARAIAAMVQSLRQQLRPTAPEKEVKGLPRWEGQVIGPLTRQEIYADVVPAGQEDAGTGDAFEALKRAAGSWSDDPDGLERYLDWNRRQRQVGRPELPE